MKTGEKRSARTQPVVTPRYDVTVSGTHPTPEHEILIADTGLAALVTAGLLDRAGFDPLLASSPIDRSPPRVTVIWEPGLRILERLGLRASVERRGTRVTELERAGSEKSWEADASSEIALVAVGRDQLQALLDQAVRSRTRVTDRVVTEFESATSGVRATFDHEGTESFDVAVTADRSLSADHAPEPDGRVHTWECYEFERRAKATESWGASAAAFAIPTGDSTSLRLVTTAETPARAAVSADDVADRFSHLDPSTADLKRALRDSGFEYRRVRLAAPAFVATGRIGLVGPAARPALPGTHLGPSTDIETAWALATSIANASGMKEALSAYERCRRELSARFRAQFDDQRMSDRMLSPEFRLLFSARRLAFSQVTGDLPFN
ncbi:FAD-dependent monooxygenase [Halorubrum californiense DSM 19288]|uniref:FAD-dependent monooxygenase n=1 Tax=Halorubrum californiense DSM 19288 TaxID=1227465 RepID=M0EQ37_9EURY|nr:FAD-dependent monooxygenase [Halorubrum californiense]ELZ49208.1 FAD-dependent monooxygenase [Halorubrum californiense DSM 19288]